MKKRLSKSAARGFVALTLGLLLLSIYLVSRSTTHKESTVAEAKQEAPAKAAPITAKSSVPPATESERQSVAKPAEHPAWPGCQVLDYREYGHKADGTFKQSTLVYAEAHGAAVQVDEKVVRKPDGTLEVLQRTEYMAGNLAATLTVQEAEAVAVAFQTEPELLMSLRDGCGIYRIDLNAQELDSVAEALHTIESELAIVGAEPDYIARALATPNDTSYGDLWHLHNTGQSGGTVDADIDAPEAWDTNTGSNTVIVAIIDSGVRLTHEDIAGNLWVNPEEIAGNGIDDDANGIVDDVNGANFVGSGAGNANANDDFGHGTHVGGIAGAVGNNATGVTGVAWDVQLMPLKFISSSGTGSLTDAIQAINYARNNGANVINNSWASGTYSAPLENALLAAADEGILLVAGAGNSAANNDFTDVYPANFDISRQVSVAATTRTDVLWSSSNYGVETVDIAAPGADILSTTFSANNSYGTMSGTSMSSAVVAGALAVLISEYPSETPEEILGRLYAGSDAVAGLASTIRTGKRLNLNGAIDYGAALPPQITSTLTAQEVEEGANVSFSVTATGTEPLTYEWKKGTTTVGTASTLNLNNVQVADGGTYSITVTNSAGSDSRSTTLTVLDILPALGQAVEAESLTWSTGRDGFWSSVSDVSFQGGDSAKSGTISDSQSTIMRTTITGPGALTFRWKVSSEAGGDTLRFRIIRPNGSFVVSEEISGEQDWAQRSYQILDTGTLTLQWRYAKDISLSEGADAGWVDAVSWVPNGVLPPEITSQPQSQTVEAGNNVNLSVNVGGIGPFTYVWKKGTDVVTNVDNITGATTGTLTFTSATVANSGNYTVEVTNAGGTTTSNVAVLTIFQGTPPPVITVQPTPATQTKIIGSSVTYTVTATGTGLTYAWTKQGDPTVLSTTNTLTLSNLTTANSGTYLVTVSNAGGSVPSNNVVLTVPANDSSLATAVNNAALNFGSFGATPWFSQTTTFQSAPSAAQSGAIGNSASTRLRTLVTAPGVLIFDWKVSSEANADTLSLEVDGSVTGTPISGNVDWTRVTQPISGTGAKEIAWAYAKDSGTTAGSDAGWVDNVTYVPLAGQAPYFLTHPANADLIAGENLSLTATAFGEGAVTYQWQKNNADEPFTTNTLTKNGVSTTDSGQYKLLATNGNGTTPSNEARVTVFGAANPLGEGLDNTDLTYTNSGNANWRPTTANSNDGTDSIRAGVIGNSQTSSFSTTVTGPGTVSFYWASSCEDAVANNADFLAFFINNVEQARIDGVTPFAQQSYQVGAGTHTLRWTYAKNASVAANQDTAWVDQLVFTQQTDETIDDWRAVNFTVGELAQPEVSGPNADPDYDGIDNATEFALGLGPKTANGDPLTAGKLRQDNVEYLTLTYTVQKGRVFTATVEKTTDFLIWNTTGVVTEQMTEDASTVTYRAKIPVPNGSVVSLRLKVTTP